MPTPSDDVNVTISRDWYDLVVDPFRCTHYMKISITVFLSTSSLQNEEYDTYERIFQNLKYSKWKTAMSVIYENFISHKSNGIHATCLHLLWTYFIFINRFPRHLISFQTKCAWAMILSSYIKFGKKYINQAEGNILNLITLTLRLKRL